MKHELLVTAIIFILLFIKLASKEWSNRSVLQWANILLLINLLAGFFMNRTGTLFGDMFRNNDLVVLQKNILNFGALIISLISYNWLLKHRHAAEFMILMLSTLLGMFFMISSQNLLMFYLGLELASIPLASMANFNLEERRSSEAALKYIMSSAFASAILLFGISMMYGVAGTLNFAALQNAASNNPMFLFAFILFLAGLGFKISAVPFHLWTADVYEGAPVAVTAYLSVVSKGAMVFVMASMLYHVFGNIFAEWRHILLLLALASVMLGNLFALRQQNIKRFLAFSSISQMGFILIGLLGGKTMGVSTVIYFVLVYLFSNLAVFGVVSVVAQQTGRENIFDYKNFYKTNRPLSWIMALGLFSLAGIPPTAGFFGKFFLILSAAGAMNVVLISIAALNIVVSFYYYLRIIKAMFMDANTDSLPAIEVNIQPRIALWLCTAGIIVTGVMSQAYEYIAELVKTVW
ncbi:MAG: NADH-quinone oxidoreductase subunit N [Ferruginibacter sp.]